MTAEGLEVQVGIRGSWLWGKLQGAALQRMILSWGRTVGPHWYTGQVHDAHRHSMLCPECWQHTRLDLLGFTGPGPPGVVRCVLRKCPNMDVKKMDVSGHPLYRDVI